MSPQGTSRLSELFVECTGEGVVLVQEEQGTNLAVPVRDKPEATEPATEPA